MQKIKSLQRWHRTDSGTEPQQELKVAMASSEISPFAKTGGLGDVMGALPLALENLGVRVSLIVPAYREVLNGNYALEDTGTKIRVAVSSRVEEGDVLRGKIGDNIPVYFIRADRYFNREGLYGDTLGDYPDNAERFVFFSRAVLEVVRQDPPDILHVHDWEPALSIPFLKAQPEQYTELHRTRTVFTVHNLGYQGVFWGLDWHLLNLDRRFLSYHFLEFYGNINFLKGGVVFADRLTTVSPSYAQEIKTPEQGFGLEGVFRERTGDLVGILNGVDYDDWNPATDKVIATPYGVDDTGGKSGCKADLQKLFGLEVSDSVPVFGMVSRLVAQKGCDLLIESMSELMKREIQFVLLGTGEQKYMDRFTALAKNYPGRMGVKYIYDLATGHRTIAGSDVLLMPSIYEPCGLTQMYGLRYGTPPLVRATGGLKDTVIEFNEDAETGNGFVFNNAEQVDFLAAVDRAVKIYSQKQLWEQLIRNGMKQDWSWKKSATTYLDIYEKTLERI